ncbi:MAG: FliH/SctL family protein [Candidatus Gastranaerophilales bacterium]|nr:FliH/SctL family protein [Candidatus Gastranaerophilales bacterium]
MIIKKKVSKKTEEEIKAEEAAQEAARIAEEEARKAEEEKKKNEEIGLFDIDKIDFTQRNERRTGNRRRGYRRIDDRNLVSRAQEEAEQIKQSAYQEGFNAGLQQAQADVANFRNVLGAFMGAEERVFNEIAPNVLELAMEIAQKIIKHEIKTDPQIVIDTVMDVMKTLSKNEPKIVLRVNPVQVQYIKDTLPEQIRLLGMETKLSVLSDEAITEGGCIIQTNNGVVDASIEAQLEIVQNALRSIE